MKKFYLAIAIITLVLIIAAGCGGSGDGITTPSSITNQTETTSSNIATLIIRVQWPGRGIPGSLMIFSENSNKNITASMPDDTFGINVEVIEKQDDPNAPLHVLGKAWIADPNTTAEISIDLRDPDDPNNPDLPLNDPNNPDILPAIEVIIRAEAYDTDDPNSANEEHLLSVTEEEIQLMVGQNPVNLDLGNYDFQLTPVPESIKFGEESTINAHLELLYPTPTDPNLPVPTPEPAKNKKIIFSIDPNLTSNLYLTADPNQSGKTITGTTDENGDCEIKLIAQDTGDIIITAMLYRTNLDKTCKVEVAGGDYAIHFTRIEPSWFAPVDQSGSLQSTLEAGLWLESPDPNTTPVPVEGKEIKFSIENPVPDGTGYTVTNNLSSYSGITGSDGLCAPVIYTYTWNIPDPTQHGIIPSTMVIIRATFEDDDGTIYTEDGGIDIWGIYWKKNTLKTIEQY